MVATVLVKTRDPNCQVQSTRIIFKGYGLVATVEMVQVLVA